MVAGYYQRHYRASGANLSYVEGPPNGPPIILLHGVGSRWQPFLPIMPALAKKYHLYALDMRGHGLSQHTPGAYRLEDYSRDVQEFLLQPVRAPAVVYGHSLGALVAIHLAAHMPDSLHALILGEPPLYYHNTPIESTHWHPAFIELLEFMTDQPDANQRRAWLAQNMPEMALERREERVRSLDGLDPDVVRAVISDALMEAVSLPALLPRVACPVLLLRGKQELGSVLRERDVNFAVTHFHDIRVLKMDIGHGILPLRLLPRIMDFIESAYSGDHPPSAA
jgi:pimeloyl-ACP methyl ester carboxylesterase